MKYLKTFMYITISILIFSIIICTLSYFNILNNNILKYIKLLSIIISIFIGGFYIGKNSKDKGYLQGIKISLLFIFIVFLLSKLGYDEKLSIDTFIYYLIIIGTSILGSIIGINKKLKQ